MSYHTDEITGWFQRWLDRFSPPQKIATNERAMQDERASLLRVLLKFAPKEDGRAWFNRITEALEYQMKTRAWPTVNELGSCCVADRKANGSKAPEWFKPADEYEIAAKRMQAAEAVSESYLYGMKARELLARGLVSDSLMQAYRSALFFKLRDVYGEDKAREMEGRLLDEHARSERPTSPEELDAARSARFRKMPQVAE